MDLDRDTVLAAAKVVAEYAVPRDWPFEYRAIARPEWLPVFAAAGWPTVEAMSAPGTAVPEPWLRSMAEHLGVPVGVFQIAEDFG